MAIVLFSFRISKIQNPAYRLPESFYTEDFMLQHTFAEKFEISGIGLHSGLPSKLVFFPSDENSGIVFVFFCMIREIILDVPCCEERVGIILNIVFYLR